MLIQAHCSTLSPICLANPNRQFPIISRRAPFNVYRSNGAANWRLGRKKNRGVIVSASEGQSSTPNFPKKRKIVEHVCLLKSKEDLSDEEEQDMLDYLYTTQYQMRGIVAISLGRIGNDNLDKYSHAFYLRFQRKEDLVKFYQNPFYLGVLKEHVSPYCHVCPDMDCLM